MQGPVAGRSHPLASQLHVAHRSHAATLQIDLLAFASWQSCAAPACFLPLPMSSSSDVASLLTFRHCQQSTIELLLRVCVAMTFFGHGYLAMRVSRDGQDTHSGVGSRRGSCSDRQASRGQRSVRWHRAYQSTRFSPVPCAPPLPLPLPRVVQTQAGWFTYLKVVGVGSKIGAPLMRLSQCQQQSSGRRCRGAPIVEGMSPHVLP